MSICSSVCRNPYLQTEMQTETQNMFRMIDRDSQLNILRSCFREG